MRTWRKIALATLAAAVALPAFADRGRGQRGGPAGHHHHTWHGPRWHPSPGAFGRHHWSGHGHYIRRHGGHRTHSHVGVSFGYPIFARPYAYSYYDYERPLWIERPNYAASGAMLGALAGAVIGHNSGDLGNNAWRGAALGGLAGLAVGAVAENRTRERERRMGTGEAGMVAEPVLAQGNAVTPTASAPEWAVVRPSRMAEANRLLGR
jgi:hypothetical protein